MNNNYIFQQLCRKTRTSIKQVFIAPAKDAHDAETDPLQVEFVELENSTIELITYDDAASIDQEVDEVKEQPCNDNTSLTVKIVENDEVCRQNTSASLTEIHEEQYSANYIELGEPHSEDDGLDLPQNDSLLSEPSKRKDSAKKLCRPRSRDIPGEVEKTRKRRQEIPLCHTCGKTVFNLPSHELIHTAEQNNECPFCFIKIKHASNLARHIQAIHLRMAVKTCSACNIGFTHYSTYRSHLYREHGIGEPHECHICSRSFSDACMLRKHNKRYHNIQVFACETCGKIFKMRV
ncbi:zinc finger protein 461-like [Anopheles maculipalpis]|uniref:zinc finger protein 461-like n=1 Tax=Anopheles maculipalpis TaxID=1496333 RepID=UPI002159B207|nr:zinc finger protein 461-like [Anopheles maculipalpis]